MLDAIAAQIHYEHTVRNLPRKFDLKDARIGQKESDRSALKRVLANKYVELAEKDSKIRDLQTQQEDSQHFESSIFD